MKLTGLCETLFIPLWAKSVEFTRKDPLISDKISYDLMQKFDYDFAKLKNAKASQVGCCIRAKLIDDEVCKFISSYPDAVVIQLGAGLDPRYERLDYPQITHWYDLDLEEVITARAQHLKESEHNTYLRASLFDYEAWISKVKAHNKPVLVILEGVLMFFEPKLVQDFFLTLCERFDQTTVVFDMLAFAAVGKQTFHDAMKKIQGVEFKWSLLDSRDMQSWHSKIKIKDEKYLSDYSNGRFPTILNLLYKIPYFYKRLNQRVVTVEIK
ncbi:class I SAM-dependent methyltransferase [Taylorella equigenitalis]|uniref:class I SAM-dependent methyltransferase n=1 Tax=Taylorella equigenitalis TaxID=29575 RepID=UPI00237EE6B6|nr:class I SAM-dependent methyltransferase [Taylorella equigenitalis]WDU52207.1 class I SAM-dependent methyltransferase [Taylorella equigenitalis]